MLNAGRGISPDCRTKKHPGIANFGKEQWKYKKKKKKKRKKNYQTPILSIEDTHKKKEKREQREFPNRSPEVTVNSQLEMKDQKKIRTKS